MSVGSNIEWTDATWNPVVGCTRASAGCDHCYAVTMTHRLERMGHGGGAKYAGLTVLNPRGDRHFNGVVRTDEAVLGVPLKWRTPRRVFVNSMSDLFHPAVPFAFIDRVFAVMALTPRHTYQVLTKRPERMAEYLNLGHEIGLLGRAFEVDNAIGAMCESGAASCRDAVREDCGALRWPLPNVWLGTSCEDQAAADTRISHLLRCPAAVRFLSCEPLLGAIDLRTALCNLKEFHVALGEAHAQGFVSIEECEEAIRKHHADRGQRPMIDWVIVGGESGPRSRPCHVEWIRSIVGQCRAAGVAVFVKQVGARPVVTLEEHSDHNWGKAVALPERDVFGIEYILYSHKGGDMGEWPEDLRVREMPGVPGGGAGGGSPGSRER